MAEDYKPEELGTKYKKYFEPLLSNSKAPAVIDETNVYQQANPVPRKILYDIIKENMAEGSRLEGKENFKAFYDAVKSGKRGLILMEHYSNLDLPEILLMLETEGSDWAKDLSSRIVPIAGMKLNEANPLVRAWTEGFTRVVIYPSRSLNSVENSNISEEEKKAEETKAKKINFAAMRAMDACKKRGEVILVFPAGTRYRPGKEETKRGLREIDSYLRLFDIMILVSNNGNCLRLNPADPENMLRDLVCKDEIILAASPVIDCKKFREEQLAKIPADDPDPKQKTVDAVMAVLEAQHNEIEKIHKSYEY
ncbi:1-acyl-sn-glycerol-3-phosphate acyltransferase [Treponema sp.]|uniref:1-acyl-sn-glycerol-3-phosphate acyltransferase n=1 Tax=Treponema sp. TaxID=166 RepID=UPI00298E5640|nr:1-acyl-sn-glycerol-3-phosphate acyltransferase [Treponema sp.]MCR5613056.1 1-acyl-sn-glycerol-3-phosphate acyltransferase [Treponema sp.]